MECCQALLKFGTWLPTRFTSPSRTRSPAPFQFEGGSGTSGSCGLAAVAGAAPASAVLVREVLARGRVGAALAEAGAKPLEGVSRTMSVPSGELASWMSRASRSSRCAQDPQVDPHRRQRPVGLQGGRVRRERAVHDLRWDRVVVASRGLLRVGAGALEQRAERLVVPPARDAAANRDGGLAALETLGNFMHDLPSLACHLASDGAVQR
jgi:hypothetical protein